MSRIRRLAVAAAALSLAGIAHPVGSASAGMPSTPNSITACYGPGVRLDWSVLDGLTLPAGTAPFAIFTVSSIEGTAATGWTQDAAAGVWNPPAGVIAGAGNTASIDNDGLLHMTLEAPITLRVVSAFWNSDHQLLPRDSTVVATAPCPVVTTTTTAAPTTTTAAPTTTVPASTPTAESTVPTTVVEVRPQSEVKDVTAARALGARRVPVSSVAFAG